VPNGEIDYIYFDVDNAKIVNTYDDLRSIYFKGTKTVHEHMYNHPENGQVLHAMSSGSETETTLRLKMHWMSKNNV